MTETRTEYRASPLPGPKLDVLVTSITDIEGEPSTDPATAMLAWEWLEENKPQGWERIALGRDDNSPAVLEIGEIHDFENSSCGYCVNPLSIGQTYPHAISLAVVEAGRLLGRIE